MPDEVDPDPTMFLGLKPLQDALEKAEQILNNTKRNLVNKGKGPRTASEVEQIAEVTSLSLDFVEIFNGVVVPDLCRDGKFELRHATHPLSAMLGVYRLHKNNQWKTGSTNTPSLSLLGRMKEQIKDDLEGCKDSNAVGEIVRSRCRVCITLEESMEIVRRFPRLYAIAERIVDISPGFCVHGDHKEKIITHSVNFLMELGFMSSFKGQHGYAMEKAFNLGSDAVRRACQLPPAGANLPAVQAMEGTEEVYNIFSWPTLIDAMWKFVTEKGLDNETLRFFLSVLRSLPFNRFMLNDLTQRMWVESPILQGFANAVSWNPNFEAIKEAGSRNITALSSDLPADEMMESIHDSIKTIDKNSEHKVRYRPPSKKELAKGFAKALREILKLCIESEKGKSVIVMQLFLKECLDKNTCDELFPPEWERINVLNADGSVAAELVETPHGRAQGKQINFLFTRSWHTIWGGAPGSYSYKQRMDCGQSFLSIMSVLEGAKLIPEGSTEKEQQIMRGCFIELEGIGGYLPDNGEGSYPNATAHAMPEGYLKNPVRAGVHYLAKAMDPENGFDPLHLIALVEVMGLEKFLEMLKIGYGVILEPGEDILSLMDRLRREKMNKDWNRRYHANRSTEEQLAAKPEDERTEEEQKTLDDLVERREKRNENKSRRRHENRSTEEQLAAKPEDERTEEEQKTLDNLVERREKSNKDWNRRYHANRSTEEQLAAKPEDVRTEEEQKTLDDLVERREKRNENKRKYERNRRTEKRMHEFERKRKKLATFDDRREQKWVLIGL